VIAALKARGLWAQNAQSVNRIRRRVPRFASDQPDRDGTKRSEAALAIWRSVVPAAGTLVETYLNSRGLCLPPPLSLRFHAGLKHPSGGVWPTMVAPRGLLDRRAAA
jgi:hypothetical protein